MDSNPYDKEFHFPSPDPWLGCAPEFGNIPISSQPGNEGFYWLWPCLVNPSAPIIINYIGGPGCCVLLKAFNHQSPLNVSHSSRTLVKNPRALTDKYNILYIEQPIGSGFSIEKIPIQNFSMDNEAVSEVLEFLLAKHPKWRQAKWFYYGESYCGLSMPIHLVFLRDRFELDFRGIFIYSPYFSQKHQQNSQDQLDFMGKNDLWDSNWEKASCWCFLKWSQCQKNLGWIDPPTFEDRTCAPLARRGKLDPTTGEFRFPVSFMNTYKKDCILLEIFGTPEHNWIVMCEKFQALIGAKKKVSSDPAKIILEEKDPNTSAIEPLSEIIKSGIQVLIVTGEGDYLLPLAGVQRAFNEMDFDGAMEFRAMPWERYDNLCQGKRLKNLEWKRLAGCGHIAAEDEPEWDLEECRRFFV